MASSSPHMGGSSAFMALGGFVVGAVVTWIWTQYWNSTPKSHRSAENALLLEDGDSNEYGSSLPSRSSLLLMTNGKSSRSVKSTTATAAACSDTFLADMLSALWQQVNAVATSEIQSAVEPMFADLPSPLSTLRFTKVCLGHVPLRLENIVLHGTDSSSGVDNENNAEQQQQAKPDYVQFNVDVIWDGECDIQMKADYIGSLGVRSLKLAGRLSVVLQPLLDASPIVGAVSYAFCNTPHLELDFTGMASVADIKSIKTTIISTILESVDAVMVLPKRSLLRMVDEVPFLKMYKSPLGIVRIAMQGGRGFETEKKSILKNDVRDVYCKVKVAKHSVWATSVVHNSANPVWSDQEQADFLMFDRDEEIQITAFDRDDGTLDLDDVLGDATVSLGELLDPSDSINSTKELRLWLDGQPTCTFVSLRCDLLTLVDNLDSLKSPTRTLDKSICGLLTILVSQAFDLPINDEVTTEDVPLDTYVNVSFGPTKFVALAVSGGTKPMYDSEFHVPIVPDMLTGGMDRLPPVVLTLLQKTPGRSAADRQLGIVHISAASILQAPRCRIAGRRSMGDTAASLEFLVSIQGVSSPLGSRIPSIAASTPNDKPVASDNEPGSLDGLEVSNGWGL
jgi:Synaptotagmin-like mitochondrial-lipid-binding domain/C2 domain